MPEKREILSSLIGAALWAGVVLVAGQLNLSVPLWVALLLAGATLAAGYVVGRSLQDNEDLPAYHADHIGEAILTLREIFAEQLPDVSFEDFIERGILAPARFGLSCVPGEEIRASILELDGSGQEFRMAYESGHSVGRKQDFSLPKVSLAGHALETGELQWTNNVEKEPRWIRHPKARPNRGYGSLVVVPIIVGGATVAVLCTLSTEKAAFLKGDLTYLELLATLIGLLWTMRPSPGQT